VPRAALHAVEGDLEHDLRPHQEDAAEAVAGSRAQAAG